MLTRLPFRVPVLFFVFLPDFFSVFMFLLVCSYIILPQGALPLLAGASLTGLLRILFWQIDVHSHMGTYIPHSLPPWSWLAGVVLSVFIWGEREQM
jgi:hypothetical protein